MIGEKKNGANEMDADLDKYSGAIREIASKNNLPLCDLRKIFADHNIAKNADDKEKGILTTDGVHLNAEGNQTVASNLLTIIKKLF